MKFRFYVTNLFEGSVQGTNDIDVAESLSISEDYFVVDSETGEWLNAGGEKLEVKEIGA